MSLFKKEHQQTQEFSGGAGFEERSVSLEYVSTAKAKPTQKFAVELERTF